MQDKKATLSYDIQNFKSIAKVRNSHISLFKVAMNSFDRGDYDTAGELFNKLSTDKFLPDQAKEKVKKNSEQINLLITEKNLQNSQKKSKADKLKNDNIFDGEGSNETDYNNKEEKSSLKDKSNQLYEETLQSDSNDKKEAKGSDIYPPLKEIMESFAGKLAESLSQVLEHTKSDKQENIIKDSISKLEDSEKLEKDAQISKNLEYLKNLNLEGSIPDILNRELNIDLNFDENTSHRNLKELSGEDIDRFLKVGSEFLEEKSKRSEIIEKDGKSSDSDEIKFKEENSLINEINEKLKNAINEIEILKKEQIENIRQNKIVDDEQFVDRLNEKDIKQSEILPKEDREREQSEILPKEDREREQSELLEKFSDKIDLINNRLKIIEEKENDIKEFSEKFKNHFKKEFGEYDDSIDKNLDKLEKSIENELEESKNINGVNLLENEIKNRESDGVEKISNKDDSIEELSKEEFDGIFETNDKKEHHTQKLSNKDDSIEELSKEEFDGIFETNDKKEHHTQELSNKEDSIEELSKNNLYDDGIIENDSYGYENEQLEISPDFDLKDENFAESFLDDIIYSSPTGDVKIGSNQDLPTNMPMFSSSDDDIDDLWGSDNNDFERDNGVEHSSKDGLLKDENDKLENTESDISNSINDLKNKIDTENKIEKNNTQESDTLSSPKDLYQELMDRGQNTRFVRENASKNSKKLRNQLDNVIPLYDDDDVDFSELSKKIEFSEDSYDQQMPNINANEIELPKGENNKYKDMDPENEEGNIEHFVTKNLPGKRNEYISELLKVENEMKNLMESNDGEDSSDLLSKLDKIKSYERLENIGRRLEREMIISHSQDYNRERSNEDNFITEQPDNSDINEAEVVTKYESSPHLNDVIEKLANVLERSFNKILDSLNKESLSEKDIDDDYFQADEEEIIIKKEDKKEKEEPLHKEDIVDDDYFQANEEVLVKKDEKGVKKEKPNKKIKVIFADDIFEKDYPGLLPDSNSQEEKNNEFLTLKDVIDDIDPDSLEFSLEDMKREELNEKQIPDLDNSTMEGAYLPYSDFEQKDGFFVDINGNPILKPEEVDDDFIEDEFSIERAEEEEPEDDLPEIEEEAPKESKKIDHIKLTYDFKELFNNKIYNKYREILNEAAQLVSEKKLDEALDYYNIILDQNIPKAFRMMIEENIKDITETIIETFKRSDTIVNVKEAGEITRLTTIFRDRKSFR